MLVLWQKPTISSRLFLAFCLLSLALFFSIPFLKFLFLLSSFLTLVLETAQLSCSALRASSRHAPVTPVVAGLVLEFLFKGVLADFKATFGEHFVHSFHTDAAPARPGHIAWSRVGLEQLHNVVPVPGMTRKRTAMSTYGFSSFSLSLTFSFLSPSEKTKVKSKR